MHSALYPLRFQPIFQRYVWGGHRLRTLLGKPTGPQPCAESWEICDRPNLQSLVAAGPLAGRSFHELIQQYGAQLLGPAADALLPLPTIAPQAKGRFPLLVKFLDAAQTISVQVHPTDTQAAQLALPDPGKTEAWIVLAAEPGSLIYAGLQPGVNRQRFLQALQKGACAELLHRFEPKPGDCVFLPAGTVHAHGAGLLVAEIQQNSDTTFRLYDWDRLGPDGKPRPLHVEQALAVLDFDQGPVHPQTPQPLAGKEAVQLVHCPYFAILQWRFDRSQPMGGDGRFHILIFLQGQAAVEGDPSGLPVGPGSCLFLPACLAPVPIIPQDGPITFLDVFLG